MTRPSYQTLCRILTLSAAALLLSPSVLAQFTNPSQDDLKTTDVPEAPGAPAIYLERDIVNDDGIQSRSGGAIPVPSYSAHVRLKVLTEEGKRYAEVTLPRLADGSNFTVDDLQARTIHADGSIVPFSGQPTERVTADGRVQVFMLPDAQVGSILEYRYKLSSPKLPPVSEWLLQSDLYTKKLDYLWRLSGKDLYKMKNSAAAAAPEVVMSSGRGGRGGGGGAAGAGGSSMDDAAALSWATLLPKGAEVKQTMQPGGVDGIAGNAGMRTVELTARDIPAAPAENFAPPSDTVLYRVVFYYGSASSPSEFWHTDGTEWSKAENAFIKPDAALTEALKSIITPSDPEETKARKIYAAMMTLTNTDLTPNSPPAPSASSAAQVWSNKKGTGNQIDELFVALARAAGMSAYVMAVANHEHGLFNPELPTLSQVPDKIAIVKIAGKEQFFDPGARYCAYGHLAWQHAAARGIRQLDGDAVSITQDTPGEPYLASVTQRVADLTVGADGAIGGPVSLYFTGAPALEWRQRALRQGEAAMQGDFKSLLAKMLPPGTDIQLITIDNLANSEQKLTVRYLVKGGIGSRAGGKVTVPADPFEAAAAPAFSSEKRDLPVDFLYPYQIQDVMRVKFPAGYSVESSPVAEKEEYARSAGYSFVVDKAPGSITVRRTVTMVDTIIPVSEYPRLKDYTARLEQKSRQNVVLKSAGTAGN